MMKKLLIDLVFWHLHSLGALGKKEQTLSAAREAGGLLPVYDGWFRECVRLFEREGYLERRGDRFAVAGAGPSRQPDELRRLWGAEKAGWVQNPDLSASHALLDATLWALPDILTGRRAATEVIFPDSSLRLVENTYKSSPLAAFFNEALAAKVAAHAERRLSRGPGPGLRILEIGAGTGATSAVVLGALNGRRLAVKEYCYTDISKAFLNHAERSYGPANPFLTYRILNIEAPIDEQGFDVGGYDIVVAANVLHATRSIRKTLRNTKALLKENGRLFLNEATGNNLFNHLTFGLLEGWWLYEDPELRLPGSPGLSVDTWRDVLLAERYRAISFPCFEAADLGQQVIVAESDGVVRLPERGRPAAPAARRAGPEAEAGRRAPGAAEGASPPAAGGRIARAIVEELSTSLRVERGRIRPDEPFSSYGLDSILAVQLTRAINEELGVDLDITVMFEHNTVDALSAHIASTFKVAAAAPPGGEQGAAPRTPPGEGAPARPLDGAEGVVVAVLAESLRIEPSRVDRDEPFSSYGLDSILAVNVTRVLNEKLGVDLDITVLFEHSTVARLCDFIAAEYGARPPAPAPAPAATAAPPEASDAGARGGGAPEGRRPEAEAAGGFAIVGMSGRFPQADDVDAFWRLIEQGRNCITPPPTQRDDWKAHADGGADLATMWGGFIDRVHEFDPLFFGISMTEARQMPPEQRLLLMCAWNALEDAGYAPKGLASRPTGVFIAVGSSEYRPAPEGPDAPAAPGLLGSPSPSMAPNRISYTLNLQGPSEHCETTCSSSLVALHRAARAIDRGECEQALVGGVNLILSPAGFGGMTSAGMLSPSGRVRPFQEGAEGTARGEGVGAIFIKPLQRAIDDGDFIYAVVKGTGVAHGGKGVSLTAPNIRGMKAAILQAYGEAGVDPGTVTYVEAHGMSSALADGAEMAALGSTLRASSTPGPGAPAGPTAHVSSLKPCVGHAEVFSGMAALMKTVLAIRHQTIPAIPGFGRLASGVSLEGSRLKIATENTPWPAPAGPDGRALPRRAGVNSFGVGGVNAHAVLEEYLPGEASPPGPPSPQIIAISAKDEDGLRARAELLVAWLGAARDVDLADVAYTLQLGREAMDYRAAVVAATPAEAADGLRAFLAGEAGDGRRGVSATGEQKNREIVELCSTEEGEALVRTLAAGRRLDVIANYWAKGAAIDWGLLHQGARRKRVPLPGYPFKRVNCSTPPGARRAPQPTPRAAAAPKSDVAVGPADFVTGLVASVLGLDAETIDRAQPLERYGLNSLLLVTMLSHLRSAFPAFQPGWLRPHDTLEGVIERLSSVAGDGTRWGVTARGLRHPELVHLNAVTRGRPVFWIHGALGSVETFQAIAARSDRPFYAIQARGFMTKHAPIEGVARMASYYIDVARSVQREGPYDLGGFCLGGIISYEMARQLQQQGEAVSSMVMVDSPDNASFARASAGSNVSAKSAALQIANSLLWPADEKDLRRVVGKLIHQGEVDSSLDDGEFVERLAGLAVGRGLSMTAGGVVEFIERNLRVQMAYKLGEYVIGPLARPESVDCTYFRNSGGLFLGELGCYFKAAGETFSLDHVNYWQDWQRELKRLRIVDIEAENHMTILYEDRALRAIGEVCEALYK